MEKTGKNIYLALKVLLFSLLLAAFACAIRSAKSGIIDLKIEPLSCELASIELSKIDVLFKIRVTNPSNRDLQINLMTYEFFVNNELISRGDYIERPVNVRAKSTRTLDRFIPIPEEKLTESVKISLRERKGIYRVKLQYTLSTGEIREKTLILPIKGMY